ncbi:MAG TPA: hypothetical protein H9663_00420 [Firmicutes bacterium]|nr:hypothetical protein [Bacillota bacterium]
MNKINGYTEEEATGLIEYIYTGKNAGKTLSYLFETYGRAHNRAKGSVRNYYYAFLKKRGDERVRRILEGKDLRAGEIRSFTEEETDDMLRKVLTEKSKGMSVRKAIRNLSEGDEKLMLRMQNKYRNLVKKQPERVQRVAREAGLPEEKTFLQRRLEREIDALYERIASDLKEENRRLREELEKLRSGGTPAGEE